jgi:hypothetical protein
MSVHARERFEERDAKGIKEGREERMERKDDGGERREREMDATTRTRVFVVILNASARVH